MPSEFGLEVDESRPPYAVLALRGDIDLYNSPRVRERLLDLVNQGHRTIVVDLDMVDFIDSTGLGVLVTGLKRVRSHDGELSLVCNQRNILKLLEITGLTSVFPMAASVDEVIAVHPTTQEVREA